MEHSHDGGVSVVVLNMVIVIVMIMVLQLRLHHPNLEHPISWRYSDCRHFNSNLLLIFSKGYYKWEGRCPAGNDCMNKSWPKVKKELWAYGEKGIDDVRDKVVHHLTTSSYHELRKDDAWDCMLQFEKEEEPIVQCEETVEERDAYRGWKDALVEKLAQRKGDAASEITTALRSCTKYATRKKPTTSMLRDAIDSIDHAAGDDDGYALLESVAAMADAGELCQTAEARLQVRKRQHEEASSLEKRRKINITLDADELKSIGHVLVRAKSDASAFKTQAQNMLATATVLEQNFARTEMLISQCQDDLTRIISLAVKAKKESEDAERREAAAKADAERGQERRRRRRRCRRSEETEDEESGAS